MIAESFHFLSPKEEKEYHDQILRIIESEKFQKMVEINYLKKELAQKSHDLFRFSE